MDNVLSQNEVNALLKAVNQGNVAESLPDEDVESEGARGYDLTSNDRIIRGRMPTLDILSQRLARLMRMSFFNMFRKNVEVTHESTQLLKYSEFIGSVSVPACLNVFRMPPLKNTCLVSVNASLMFGLVDHVFGGKGSWYRVEGREYSSIELRLIREVVDLCLNDLGTAWTPVLKVSPEYLRTEVNPQFAAITAPTDVCVEIVFLVELEGTTRGYITLLIPYSVIEPIRRRLSSALQTEHNTEDNSWRKVIARVIYAVDAEFEVSLGRGHVTLKDLMSLKVGDTLRLAVDASSGLPCKVEGVVKVTGRPVKSRGKLAVRLDDLVGATQHKTQHKEPRLLCLRPTPRPGPSPSPPKRGWAPTATSICPGWTGSWTSRWSCRSSSAARASRSATCSSSRRAPLWS